MGLMPTISDGGFVLWESNAIVRYLSAEYGSGTLWPDDNRERALADKWMDYGLGTLFSAFREALVGHIRTPADQRDEAKIASSAQNTARVLSLLDILGVQFLGHVVGGSADRLHAPLVRPPVGVGPCEGRQERVVDVDDPVRVGVHEHRR